MFTEVCSAVIDVDVALGTSEPSWTLTEKVIEEGLTCGTIEAQD